MSDTIRFGTTEELDELNKERAKEARTMKLQELRDTLKEDGILNPEQTESYIKTCEDIRASGLADPLSPDDTARLRASVSFKPGQDAWLHLEADDLTYLFEVVFPAANRDLMHDYFDGGGRGVPIDDRIDKLLNTEKRWLDSAKDKGYVGHPDD